MYATIAKGYRILARRFRTPYGEIDIVARRRNLLTFVEVKARATLDDAADGITLVTRGLDLFAASHVHRLLQALLGLPVPTWHHHQLLCEEDGRKLAKRRGSPALADLRRAGADGRALATALRTDQFPTGLWLGAGVGSAT